MYQPPPLGNQRWKETYSETEVAHMFKVRNGTIEKVAKKVHCGNRVGREAHYTLEHIEKIYYNVSDNARKRYDLQFKK